MKRASKQAQSAVAKVATYRKSKAAAPKSGPGGANRPNPRRGDDRVVVGSIKPKGDKATADRKKAVVEAGKTKARDKNAAKAAEKAAQARAKAPKSGPAPNNRPAPSRPEQPRGSMKPARPAPPQMGRPSAPPRPPVDPATAYDPGMKGRY